MAAGPTVVVAGLLRRGDRVLLGHRHPDRINVPNVWDLPGGHVEPGEALPTTLVRELREELGVEVAEPSGAAWETLHAVGVELHVFLVDRWRGEPTNAAPDEHDEIRWVAASDLPTLQLAHDSYEAMLRRAIAT